MSTRHAINAPIPVPERVIKVMAMLRGAAERNEPCPTNMQIATAIGAQSMSAGANAIGLLESMNLIRVERGHMTRVVTIVTSGQRTAGKAGGKRPAREHFWTAGRDDHLMDAVSEERSFAAIAVDLGTTEQECSRRFDELAGRLGRQAA